MKKYSFSRAKWYDIHPPVTEMAALEEIYNWCIEVFGKHDMAPDAWSRWSYSAMQLQPRFRFRDEKDYVAFTLRWA